MGDWSPHPRLKISAPGCKVRDEGPADWKISLQLKHIPHLGGIWVLVVKHTPCGSSEVWIPH